MGGQNSTGPVESRFLSPGMAGQALQMGNMLGGTGGPPQLPSDKSADQFAPIVQSMKRDYPLLANIPFTVGKGTGPYQSEVYEPWVKDSPTPGQFHIQLRHYLDQPRSQEDIRKLATGETFHYLGKVDPRTDQPVNKPWYDLKQQVLATMPPHDLENARDRWKEEQAQPQNERRSFDEFLQTSYLDQYIGGTMFPLSNEEEWVQRARNLPRTAPKQAAVIERMRQLLTTGR